MTGIGLRTGRCFVQYAIVATLLMSSHVAYAISGTLTGTVSYLDDRKQGSTASGSQHIGEASPQVRPVSGARIYLSNLFGETGSTTTAANGSFSISWNDNNTWFFPANYDLKVELKNGTRFHVTNTISQQIVISQPVTITSSSQNAGVVNLSGIESVYVYATAREFTSRITTQSPRLNTHMVGLNLSTMHGGSPCSSTANSKTYVKICDGRGRNNPVTTVAHEMGHVATFVGLERNDVNQLYDLGPDGSHSMTSVETEKVAWWEGVANFFGLAFAWTRSSPNALFNGMNHEACGGTCASHSTPYKMEFCIGCAMWDVYDDRPSDDEISDFTMSEIIDTLVHYPHSSWWVDDRCDDEWDVDGTNHWDFLANVSSKWGSNAENMVRGVYNQSSIRLSVGGSEPF